jgi:hypothetical protein
MQIKIDYGTSGNNRTGGKRGASQALSSTPMKMGRKSCIFIAGGEPGFMKALSILILKSNRQIELCF